MAIIILNSLEKGSFFFLFGGRCFYLAKSYSSAGKRTEAYALYGRARSLADDALQKLQASSEKDQVCIRLSF